MKTAVFKIKKNSASSSVEKAEEYVKLLEESGEKIVSVTKNATEFIIVMED